MKKFITHVGMDTDSRGFDIAIAEGFGSDNSELRSWGRIPATLEAVDKLIKQLRRQGYKELRFVYEAGPCGFGLYRHLQGREGIVCAVIAPSKIPRQPGERVKTNRRDARKLAQLDRGGNLEAIYVPSEEDEAMRDLRITQSAARVSKALHVTVVRSRAVVVGQVQHRGGRCRGSQLDLIRQQANNASTGFHSGYSIGEWPPLRWRQRKLLNSRRFVCALLRYLASTIP